MNTITRLTILPRDDMWTIDYTHDGHDYTLIGHGNRWIHECTRDCVRVQTDAPFVTSTPAGLEYRKLPYVLAEIGQRACDLEPEDGDDPEPDYASDYAGRKEEAAAELEDMEYRIAQDYDTINRPYGTA